MSLKRLLPIAGLVALIGCASPSGPGCFREETHVIGLDSLATPVTVEARVQSAECSDLENDF